MTLKQALKKKNKLVKEMQEHMSLAQRNNSYSELATRNYSSRVELGKSIQKMNELIDLKTRIHIANQPVYELIFRLSELKTLIRGIKSISTTEGVSSRGYSEESIKFLAEMNEVETRNLVKQYEDEIESIQEKLDHHNAVTEI